MRPLRTMAKIHAVVGGHERKPQTLHDAAVSAHLGEGGLAVESCQNLRGLGFKMDHLENRA